MRRIVAIILAVVSLGAQEWALIAHPASPLKSLNLPVIKDIYLGRQHFVGDVRVMPLQLGADDPLRAIFEREALGMSRQALHEWWIRRHYLGERPPKVMGSPEAIVAYVQQVETAIGYVPFLMVEDVNVTVLYIGGEGSL